MPLDDFVEDVHTNKCENLEQTLKKYCFFEFYKTDRALKNRRFAGNPEGVKNSIVRAIIESKGSQLIMQMLDRIEGNKWNAIVLARPYIGLTSALTVIGVKYKKEYNKDYLFLNLSCKYAGKRVSGVSSHIDQFKVFIEKVKDTDEKNIMDEFQKFISSLNTDNRELVLIDDIDSAFGYIYKCERIVNLLQLQKIRRAILKEIIEINKQKKCKIVVGFLSEMREHRKEKIYNELEQLDDIIRDSDKRDAFYLSLYQKWKNLWMQKSADAFLSVLLQDGIIDEENNADMFLCTCPHNACAFKGVLTSPIKENDYTLAISKINTVRRVLECCDYNPYWLIDQFSFIATNTSDRYSDSVVKEYYRIERNIADEFVKSLIFYIQEDIEYEEYQVLEEKTSAFLKNLIDLNKRQLIKWLNSKCSESSKGSTSFPIIELDMPYFKKLIPDTAFFNHKNYKLRINAMIEALRDSGAIKCEEKGKKISILEISPFLLYVYTDFKIYNN